MKSESKAGLTPVEKKRELYLRQKRVLDEFLERGAITQAQYEKSFRDLTEKMNMREVFEKIKGESWGEKG